MENKQLVIRELHILENVACYKYTCGRCGYYEYLTQMEVKAFNKLAPKGWCCISQDNREKYYCDHCSKEIGIGV